MKGEPSILIVEDDEDYRTGLARLLREKGYEIETTGTGKEAIKKARERFFNIALLDIKIPDVEGIELLAPLKEMYPDIEIIIVTGYASLKTTMQALNGGAAAYITKPLKIDELVATLREVLERQRELMQTRIRIKSLKRELALRKKSEKKLAYIASHDALTGLLTREVFQHRLTLELAHARRSKHKVVVMLLDLDNFKEINDTFGHSEGDEVLKIVGSRLISILRKSDTVARLGGDEFLVLLPEVNQGKDVIKLTHKILEAIRIPYVFGRQRININASIGIAVSSGGSEDAETLIRRADLAMYSAKGKGRGTFQFYKEWKAGNICESQYPESRGQCGRQG